VLGVMETRRRGWLEDKGQVVWLMPGEWQVLWRHRDRYEGDRKGPHPTQHRPRPYNETCPLPDVVVVSYGYVRSRPVDTVLNVKGGSWKRGKMAAADGEGERKKSKRCSPWYVGS
jgi:hypothetical protein